MESGEQCAMISLMKIAMLRKLSVQCWEKAREYFFDFGYALSLVVVLYPLLRNGTPSKKWVYTRLSPLPKDICTIVLQKGLWNVIWVCTKNIGFAYKLYHLNVNTCSRYTITYYTVNLQYWKKTFPLHIVICYGN